MQGDITQYDIKGKKHGKWVTHHTNGRLMYTGEYIHGKMHGAWTGYNPDGGVWAKQTFDMGKPIGYNIAHWYNGKLSYKRFYAN
jgi:antitoxin component YwqK of YwqJK toxin-antitoxin module